MAENAIIQGREAGTAINREQENLERNFGMGGEGGGEAVAPHEGEPKPEPKGEELPEKFRGKTTHDIAKSALEAERQMHEATEKARRSDEENRRLQAQASQSDIARQRYEQLIAERAKPTGPDPVRERFRKFVNENDEVFDSVAEVAAAKAREVAGDNTRLDDLERKLQKSQATIFSLQFGSQVKSDPQLAELLPEIQQAALDELGYLHQSLIEQGVSPDRANATVQALNIDPVFADGVRRRVLGSKGSEFWAKQNKQPQPDPVVDDAKKHLGAGGAAPDTSDPGDTELRKLLAKPGSTNDPKVRDMLVKKGILPPR